MGKFELKSGARLAAAAGLGLTLALGAAPVVALADGETSTWEGPVASQVFVQDFQVSLMADGNTEDVDGSTGETVALKGEGTEASPYVVESAQELQLALNQGGYVKLAASINSNAVGSGTVFSVPSNKSVTLDLAGFSIAANGNTGQVLTSSGVLSIVNSGETKGSISGGNITVASFSTLTMTGVKVSNDANIGVFNLGSLSVDSCELDGCTPLYITGKNGSTVMENDVVATISNCTVSNGDATEFWGIVVLGKGLDAQGSYSNDDVLVNVSDCSVTSSVEGQGICTNASSGAYAGFTLNVTGTTISFTNPEQGCGFYLPGIGSTTIDDCTVSGSQGIRIAAGDLSVTGGSQIIGTAAMGSDDLISGGSGGTLGAIVVGKASNGYVGDINVTVDKTCTLKNSATTEEGDISSAVVVSDKNMASDSYDNNTITVVIEGALVQGDVVKASTVDASSTTETQDGGLVYLNVSSAEVKGNVINQSKTGITLENSTVTGNVTNAASGSVAVVDSTVNGTVSNSGTGDEKGSVTVVSSSIGALGDNQSITTVDTTVNGNKTPDTADAVAMAEGVSYDSLSSALQQAEAGETVYLLQDVTSNEKVSIPAGVTLDGKGHTLTCGAKIDSGAFVEVGIDADGVIIKDLAIDTNDNAKHGVQFYCNEGGSLSNVTVKGGSYTSVIVNGSKVNISGCTLEPDASAYAHIEYAMGSSVTSVPEISLSDVTAKGSQPFVYLDKATFDRVEAALGEGEFSDSTVLGAINDKIDGADLVLSETGGAVTPKPSTPVTPPAQTGDAVKVEQSEGGKVTVSPSRADEGDEVTVTVAPDEGQELRGLTVTDEDGSEVEVRAGEKDGEFVFVMPDGDVTVSAEFGCDGGASCPTHGFADVDQSDWYHDAIDWAVTNKVLNGYGDDGELMGPLATITRAEMAQVLWNRAGRPAAEADLSGFADVDASGWYADPVAWCLSEGIFQGYGDTFGTERPISREEVATVLWRLSGEPEGSLDLSSFSDSASVSDYATDALAWAVESGVVTGKDDGTKLDPQGVCTRAEVAAMLMRMSE